MSSGWAARRDDASPFKKAHELQARTGTMSGCNCGWYCGDKEVALMVLGKVLRCHKCGGTMYMDETTFIDHAGYTRIMYDTKESGRPAKFLVMKIKFIGFYVDYLKSNLDKLELSYDNPQNPT